MEYRGIKSCLAAKQLFGGEGACPFGCLGYGDCQKVCPGNAICLEDSLARINKNLCSGCGLCVSACPNNLIAVKSSDITVSVFCGSTEKGATLRKKCANCCLGCGKCARECPAKAIEVKDNLAVIDYEKCTNCGKCAEVCVSGSIQRIL